MIKINGGDDRTIRIEGIHRIEPATKTDFEDGHVDTSPGKYLPCSQCSKFEESQRCCITHSLDCGKSST